MWPERISCSIVNVLSENAFQYNWKTRQTKFIFLIERNIRLLFLTVYKRIGFYSLYAYKSAYVVFGCGWLKIEHVNAVDYVSVMHSSSLKSIFSIEKNWLLVLHYAWRRSASTRFHGLNITYPWVDVNFHNIEYSLLLCIVASFFLCVHPSIRISLSRFVTVINPSLSQLQIV